MNNSFFNLKATSINGKDILMNDYKGKVVVVVNTASRCGLTPQYEGLQELYRKYKNKGLVILGFPCNQFAHQEPGDVDSIKEVCQVNYGVTFPMFEKIDVNGNSTHPLFKHLKDELKGVIGNSIKWNFTKFLVGRDGKGIKRFSPKTAPKDIENYIVEALESKEIK